MKYTVRLGGAIWLAELVVTGGFAYMQIAEERHRLTKDLERRAALLGEALHEAVEPALVRSSHPGIERLLKKFGRRDQGIAIYDKVATLTTGNPDIPPLLPAS